MLTEVDLRVTVLDWQNRGLCLGTDPDKFFPAQGESQAPAKAICAQCPVKRECLEYALARPEQHGIWGGLSERERKRLRRRIAARQQKINA